MSDANEEMGGRGQGPGGLSTVWSNALLVLVTLGPPFPRSLNRITTTNETIIFSQLRWRAVTIPLLQKYFSPFFIGHCLLPPFRKVD